MAPLSVADKVVGLTKMMTDAKKKKKNVLRTKRAGGGAIAVAPLFCDTPGW